MEAATVTAPNVPAGYKLHEVGSNRHCANCYGQYADRRYVECPASYDGPVVNQLAVVTEPGVDAIAIDELILCEHCIEVIARMVGLVRAPDLTKELVRLQDENEKLATAKADSDRALSDMHVAHRSLVERRSHVNPAGTRKPENVPDPGTPSPR